MSLATADVLCVGVPAGEQQALAQAVRGVSLSAVADLPSAISWLDRAAVAPAVIVVTQAWPGQIAEADLAQLRQRAPLARVCGWLGAWCEGEVRSGKPWPGTLRVYDHQARPRLARELQALVRGAATAWDLPVTASEEERLLAEIESGQPARGGTVAIVAANPQTLSALADACSTGGYVCLAMRDPRGIDAPQAALILWDVTATAAADARQVAELKAISPSAAIVALLGFPRADEIESARRAGVAAVVSKPFRLADLFWQMAALQSARQA